MCDLLKFGHGSVTDRSHIQFFQKHADKLSMRLINTLWYSYIIQAADKSKRGPIWEITSLKNESDEDKQIILSRLNSLAKSEFYINSEGWLYSKNYLFHQKSESTP
jgi:hypothetical protein